MNVHIFESTLDDIISKKDQWTVTFLEITKENLNTAEKIKDRLVTEYLQEICII